MKGEADELTKVIIVRKQKETNKGESYLDEKSLMPSRKSEKVVTEAGSTEDKTEKQVDKSMKMIVVKKWKETNKG
ncbi:9660_t:CDS:2 [Acaulospora morrowiae]|uniref:9660_t:CDS:1 n=1 Tax=Acaulospora morrowiae TaxID=94023 RepID=A0A9N9BCQ7_9GLOM|nr:9660_t:CDS:2 [Acaulospora morrowiae]